MAAYAELILDQGTTFNTIITVTDDTTNLPVNVTNYVISANIKKSYYSANNTSEFQTTINDAANGNISISMTASNSALIKAGRYLYDVKITSPANSITRVVEGIVTVTPRVSWHGISYWFEEYGWCEGETIWIEKFVDQS